MKFFCALLLALSAAVAQTDGYSETRELTLASTGALSAETPVGSITIQGWDKDFIMIRATVTNPLVQINISTNRLWAAGPSGESWTASYEIFVPRHTDVRAHSHVGSIAVTDLAGTLSFETNVGSVALTNFAGDVDVTTHVGSIAANVTGAGWEGKGLSLTANTGAIHITAAPDYAARFDLRTNMGSIVTNAPGARVVASGFFARRLVYGAGDGLIQATVSLGEISLQIR